MVEICPACMVVCSARNASDSPTVPNMGCGGSIRLSSTSAGAARTAAMSRLRFSSNSGTSRETSPNSPACGQPSSRENCRSKPAGSSDAGAPSRFSPLRSVNVRWPTIHAAQFAFGMFGRMMLLRWRRGWLVGAVLGGLVLFASWLGEWFRAAVDLRGEALFHPLLSDFHLLLVATALTVLFAAVVVWPIWLALAHLFLPARTAAALLDWQRSIPSAEPILARQE